MPVITRVGVIGPLAAYPQFQPKSLGIAWSATPAVIVTVRETA
jgi:hypothetical protein